MGLVITYNNQIRGEWDNASRKSQLSSMKQRFVVIYFDIFNYLNRPLIIFFFHQAQWELQFSLVAIKFIVNSDYTTTNPNKTLKTITFFRIPSTWMGNAQAVVFQGFSSPSVSTPDDADTDAIVNWIPRILKAKEIRSIDAIHDKPVGNSTPTTSSGLFVRKTRIIKYASEGIKLVSKCVLAHAGEFYF